MTTLQQPLFNRIIQASLEELIELQYDMTEWPASLRMYLEALIAYHQGDLPRLAQIAQPERRDVVSDLISLRLHIRKRAIGVEACTRALSWIRAGAAFHDECDWAGEILIVAGMGFEVQGMDRDSMKYYALAEKALAQTGALKKSVRAKHNAVCAETHIFPDRRIVKEYFDVYHSARKLGELALAGQALLNLGWELTLIRAYSAALKFINRALPLLDREIGSKDHDLALLQRAFLLALLGRSKESLLDIDATLRSEYPETIATRNFLSTFAPTCLKSLRQTVEESGLPIHWRQNLTLLSRSKTQPLSDLENRLVYLLCIRPRTFKELARLLYGERLPTDTSKARLEQVLASTRRKQPGLICYRSGLYALEQGKALDGLEAA